MAMCGTLGQRRLRLCCEPCSAVEPSDGGGKVLAVAVLLISLCDPVQPACGRCALRGAEHERQPPPQQAEVGGEGQPQEQHQPSSWWQLDGPRAIQDLLEDAAW